MTLWLRLCYAPGNGRVCWLNARHDGPHSWEMGAGVCIRCGAKIETAERWRPEVSLCEVCKSDVAAARRADVVDLSTRGLLAAEIAERMGTTVAAVRNLKRRGIANNE